MRDTLDVVAQLGDSPGDEDVVGERKQSKSSKACCRCEDRFTDIDREVQELIRISIGWFDLLVETYWLV